MNKRKLKQQFTGLAQTLYQLREYKRVAKKFNENLLSQKIEELENEVKALAFDIPKEQKIDILNYAIKQLKNFSK